MVRRGISLSAYAERKWAKKAIRQAGRLLLAWLVFSASAFWLNGQAEQAKARYHQQSEEAVKLRDQQLQLEMQLARRQSQQSSKAAARVFSPVAMATFLTHLRQLPIQGGLEQVELSLTPSPQWRLSGLVEEHATFNALENYLKQQKLAYQPLHLHTNEHQQLEFELLIAIPLEETP